MTNDFSGGLRDSDHRLLSGNPSGCAQVSQLYECLWEGRSYAKEKSKMPVYAGSQPARDLLLRIES